MTLKEGENFSMPSVGSNQVTISTLTIDATLASSRRKSILVVWNDFEKVIVDR